MLHANDIHAVHAEQRGLAERLWMSGYPSLMLIHQ